MNPGVSSTSIVTRMTVAWLEDIGYQVNYNDLVPTNIRADCICSKPKRRLVRHLGWMDLNGVHPSNKTSAPKRKLSVEGYNAAMAYGLSHLNDMHKSYNKTTSSARGGQTRGFQYVGDQVVSVMYVEEGTMYGIVVRRE
jgi:hypothetical protein